MNLGTNIFGLEDQLINCIKDCFTNISSFSNIANFLDNNTVKQNLQKEKMQQPLDNQYYSKKNNFEMILNSTISLFDLNKFISEKTFSPIKCPFCKKINQGPFNINYVKINLDNYLGVKFNLDEFMRPVSGEETCRNCKKKMKSQYYFTLLPEILVVVLGAKSQNRTLNYNYNHIFRYFDKNNKPIDFKYTLKSLIGEIGELKYKSFLFKDEKTFRNNFQRNEDIFKCPTILFYEGPKKPNNPDNEHLEANYIEPEESDENNNKITIYFNFPKFGKKIYIDTEPDEKFSNVISELKEKYNWLKGLKNLKFYLGNKLLELNKTLNENGIKDNSDINII